MSAPKMNAGSKAPPPLAVVPPAEGVDPPEDVVAPPSAVLPPLRADPPLPEVCCPPLPGTPPLPLGSPPSALEPPAAHFAWAQSSCEGPPSLHAQMAMSAMPVGRMRNGPNTRRGRFNQESGACALSGPIIDVINAQARNFDHRHIAGRRSFGVTERYGFREGREFLEAVLPVFPQTQGQVLVRFSVGNDHCVNHAVPWVRRITRPGQGRSVMF